MNVRKALVAATAGIALAGAVASAPAQAAGETAVVLSVTTAGTIGISVPDGSTTPVDLGPVAAGSTAAASGALGTVTVTDTRTGLLNNNWTASAVSTNLLLDGVAANATDPQKMIPASSLGYTAGTLNTDSAATGAVVTALDPATLAASAPVVTNVALGAGTVSWAPALKVTVLPTVIAGAYKGTVTHSVL